MFNQSFLQPKKGLKLKAMIEPSNVVDKYTVCVKRNDTIVRYLPKGPKGRFAKTIFFFLKTE